MVPFWGKICVILCIGFVVYVYMSGLGLREGRGKGRGKLARKGKGKWKGTGKERGKGKGKGGESGKKENWVPRRGRGCAARRNRRPLEMQGIASKAGSVCWKGQGRGLLRLPRLVRVRLHNQFPLSLLSGSWFCKRTRTNLSSRATRFTKITST